MPICLRNLSIHSLEIPTKAIVGKVTLTNQVLLVVLLAETLGDSTHGPWKGCDPGGIEHPGPKVEQEQAQGAAAQMRTPDCPQ